MELREYIELLLKRKDVVLGTFLLVFVSILIYTFFAPPVYEATAKLLISKDAGSINPIFNKTSAISSLLQGNSDIETNVELIKDRPVMNEVVRSLDLRNKKGELVEAEELLRSVKVVPLRDTDIIQIKVSSNNAEQAALIANTICQRYVAWSQEMNQAEARSVKQFLEEQVKSTKSTLTHVEEVMLKYRKKSGSIQLSSEMQVKIDKLAELEIERTKVTVALREFTARLTSGALGSDVTGLTERKKALDSALAKYNNELKGLPQKELEIARLMRDQKVADTTYVMLLEKLNEVKISEAMKTSNAKLVSPAVPPSDPVRPKKLLNILMGLIVGLMCGSGVAFLIEYFDVSVKSTEEAKQITGLSLLGIIPLMKQRKKDAPFEYLITNTDPRSSVSEAFRTLEVDIKFSSSEMGGKVVLFTSALPGEGKSSTVSNYAIIKAQGGHRTVLIDADMRKPLLDKLFSVTSKKGLSDVLVGDAPVEDVLQKTVINGLDIVPAGIIPPNPASLLESPQLKTMLDYLSSKYDSVLIDSPPLVGLPDALHLCGMADGVVLVIAYGKSSRPVIKEAKDILVNSKAKMLGFVLTMFDRGGEIYRAYYKSGAYYSANAKDK